MPAASLQPLLPARSHCCQPLPLLPCTSRLPSLTRRPPAAPAAGTIHIELDVENSSSHPFKSVQVRACCVLDTCFLELSWGTEAGRSHVLLVHSNLIWACHTNPSQTQPPAARR